MKFLSARPSCVFFEKGFIYQQQKRKVNLDIPNSFTQADFCKGDYRTKLDAINKITYGTLRLDPLSRPEGPKEKVDPSLQEELEGLKREKETLDPKKWERKKREFGQKIAELSLHLKELEQTKGEAITAGADPEELEKMEKDRDITPEKTQKIWENLKKAQAELESL